MSRAAVSIEFAFGHLRVTTAQVACWRSHEKQLITRVQKQATFDFLYNKHAYQTTGQYVILEVQCILSQLFSYPLFFVSAVVFGFGSIEQLTKGGR